MHRMNPDTMIASAKALDEKLIAAYNRGDTDTLASLYATNPDVVLYPPDETEARGNSAIKQCFAQSLNDMHGGQLELTERHYRVAGNDVIGWGKWRMTMPATKKKGTPIALTGRYTDVKTQQNGKWVYIVDHASTPTAQASKAVAGKKGSKAKVAAKKSNTKVAAAKPKAPATIATTTQKPAAPTS